MPRGLLLAPLLALLCACGEEDPTPRVAPGSYVLDRVSYAQALVHARHPEAAADDAARAATAEAARKAAGSVQLQLDLAGNGTFLVSYRFPGERGRRRGAWSQAGDRLTLRITHDAAGPVQRGAEVEARLGAEGIYFEGWPVPNAFLLRPK